MLRQCITTDNVVYNTLITVFISSHVLYIRGTSSITIVLSGSKITQYSNQLFYIYIYLNVVYTRHENNCHVKFMSVVTLYELTFKCHHVNTSSTITRKNGVQCKLQKHDAYIVRPATHVHSAPVIVFETSFSSIVQPVTQ